MPGDGVHWTGGAGPARRVGPDRRPSRRAAPRAGLGCRFALCAPAGAARGARYRSGPLKNWCLGEAQDLVDLASGRVLVSKITKPMRVSVLPAGCASRCPPARPSGRAGPARATQRAPPAGIWPHCAAHRSITRSLAVPGAESYVRPSVRRSGPLGGQGRPESGSGPGRRAYGRAAPRSREWPAPLRCAGLRVRIAAGRAHWTGRAGFAHPASPKGGHLDAQLRAPVDRPLHTGAGGCASRRPPAGPIGRAGPPRAIQRAPPAGIWTHSVAHRHCALSLAVRGAGLFAQMQAGRTHWAGAAAPAHPVGPAGGHLGAQPRLPETSAAPLRCAGLCV